MAFCIDTPSWRGNSQDGPPQQVATAPAGSQRWGRWEPGFRISRLLHLDDRAHTSGYQAGEGKLVFKAGTTALSGEVRLKQDERFVVEAYLPGEGKSLPDAVGTMAIVDYD